MAASRDILIQVADLTTATAFYTQTLGLKEFLRTPMLVGLEAGALRLYLEKGRPLGPVLEFFVTDLKAAKLAILAFGGTLIEENPEIPRCYVRDRFGVVYNLVQEAVPAAAEGGEAAEDGM